MRLRIAVVAAVLLCSGCYQKFIYHPHGPVTGAPAKYTAAVAMVDDKSSTVPPEQEGGVTPQYNFAVNDGLTWNALAPKKMTDYIIEDLSASGLFSMVSAEGEGDADILIRPTYRKAYLTEFCGRNGMFTGHLCYDIGLEIEALKGGRLLMKKVYDRRWKMQGHIFTYGHVKVVAKNLAELMDDVRKDLDDALKTKGGR